MRRPKKELTSKKLPPNRKITFKKYRDKLICPGQATAYRIPKGKRTRQERGKKDADLTDAIILS